MPSPLTERFAAEYFTLNSTSPKRRDRMLHSLARFERFLDGVPLQEATDHDLRAWLVALLDEGLMPSTVNLLLRCVMPFYQWCWRERLLEAERLLRLRDVSPPRGWAQHAPRPYSRKELARMWAQLDARWPYATPLVLKRWRNGTSPVRSVKKHAMRLQLNAIIDLALVAGLRLTEIHELSIEDCHWDNKYLVVHGKRTNQNEKLREVPYASSTREAIHAWCRFRATLSPQPGVGLWLSVTGPDPAAAMSHERISALLRTCLGDWEMHRLRHTCATERLRAGMELEKLQRFLGHSDIEMTQRYTQLVRSDIHAASERVDADFQRAIRPPGIRAA